MATIDEEDINYNLVKLSIKEELRYHLFPDFDQKLD